MARQVLVAADREVTVLTAEAEAADAELPAKRQCTRAPLEAWETATQGWSAEQWSAFEAAEQKRRAKPIDNETEDPDLKRGAEGFLHDFRRGLLGAVQSWANGRRKAVVHMVMSLIGSKHGFGIEDEVRERLADPAVKREAQTNAYIVDRLAATINVFKQFGTEEARETLHVLLGSVSPPVVDPTDHAARNEGMQRRVWERLNVRRGRRARTAQQKQANELGRPFVSLQATLTRQVFDAQVEAAKKPLKVGNTASPCPCPCPCPSVGKVLALGQLAIVLVYTPY